MMRVFLSSTTLDLQEYRVAVAKAVRDADDMAVEMEDFYTQGDAVAVSLQQLASCNLFIGLYANRFGFCPNGSPRSITQIEYDAARERKLPQMVFMLDEAYAQTLVGTDSRLEKFRETDPLNIQRLESFKAQIGRDLPFTTFTTPSDLAAKVLIGLRQWSKEISE